MTIYYSDKPIREFTIHHALLWIALLVVAILSGTFIANEWWQREKLEYRFNKMNRETSFHIERGTVNNYPAGFFELIKEKKPEPTIKEVFDMKKKEKRG